MAHTPGPWKAMNNNAGFLYDYGVVQDDGGNPFAYKVVAAMPDEDDEDWEANALLIAAAPDLLAACEAMMAAFEEPGNPVLYTGPMLAAIAKAKGETA